MKRSGRTLSCACSVRLALPPPPVPKQSKISILPVLLKVRRTSDPTSIAILQQAFCFLSISVRPSSPQISRISLHQKDRLACSSRQRKGLADPIVLLASPPPSKMGKPRPGAKLPKRSVIERLTRAPAACAQEMLSVLSCFKDNNFNEARCGGQMKALAECVNNRPAQANKQKSTVFYHLKRLYHQRRR